MWVQGWLGEMVFGPSERVGAPTARESWSVGSMIYCVIPVDLASSLHEDLRTFYRGDPLVEVVVDLRNGDRRSGHDRRIGFHTVRRERRRARRRWAADRRAVASLARPVRLPPLSRAEERRIRFVQFAHIATRALEELDSARLAGLAAGGDGAAFDALYLRYYDRVYAQLAIALDDNHEAEDATQDVFARLVKALPTYKPNAAPFWSWLQTVAANVARTRLARRKRFGERLPGDDQVLALHQRDLGRLVATDPADLWDRHRLYLAELLPKAQRRVLVLRRVLDLDHRQIALVMERSPEAVRKLETRAIEEIERRLKAAGPGPERGRRMSMRVRMKPAPVMAARRWALTSGGAFGHRRR